MFRILPDLNKRASQALCWTALGAALGAPSFCRAAAAFKVEHLDTYETGRFDEGAAEIAAYDPATKRLFVTNADANTMDILNLNDPSDIWLISSIDVGGGINSVDVSIHGVVAVAVEADDADANGEIKLYDVVGQLLNSFEAGVLPDKVGFTPDGLKVLTANEGQPLDDYSVNPEGSVTVVDLGDGLPATVSGLGSSAATTLNFNAFDSMYATLEGREVRLPFPDSSVSESLEPEYIAFKSDSSRAYVSLQENNAIAVVDLVSMEITDILPLGLKDHWRGLPELMTMELDLSDFSLGTTATVNPQNSSETTPGQDLELGGMSGLYFVGYEDGGQTAVFVATPDRGPNGESVTDPNDSSRAVRPFPLPDYQCRLVFMKVDLDDMEVSADTDDQLMLFRQDGTTPITGLPNQQSVAKGLAYTDEFPVDLWGNDVPNDPYGADFESIIVAPDGTYWLSDEYRPAIYHFNADGHLIERYIPEGSAVAASETEGFFGKESLPAVYAQRRANRGFEGMALQDGKLYAFIQSPIDNPDAGNDASSKASSIIRILVVDAVGGVDGGSTEVGDPVAEYIYVLSGIAGVDKIGDAVSLGNGTGKFLVAERDSGTDATSTKLLYEVWIKGATDILGTELSTATGADTALESMTADDLREIDVQPVDKRKIINLPTLGYLAGDKVEGVAYIPYGPLEGSIAIINDNDFQMTTDAPPFDGTVPVNPDPTPTILGLIGFDPATTAFDASDRDSGINFRNWPVFGMYMPDSITAYEVGGATYLVTANEGDSIDYDGYSEEIRFKDFGDDLDDDLDPETFPDFGWLKLDPQIGRLKTSVHGGDLDGDGLKDRLYAYGARSFSIWDEKGQLVFDSGSMIERITALETPNIFNSEGTVDGFDSRSDDKGPEPEGLFIGEIDGVTYLFLTLERVSAVMIFDISDPHAPEYIETVSNRQIYGDAEALTAGDIAPEHTIFVPAEDSPIGSPILIVMNEVSGTTSTYRLNLNTFAKLFPSAPQVTPDWYYVEWFGWVFTRFYPWIYQPSFGYGYAVGDENNLWLWNQALGWVYTNQVIYPSFYSVNTGNYLYLQTTGNGDTRWMYDFSTGEWFSTSKF